MSNILGECLIILIKKNLILLEKKLNFGKQMKIPGLILILVRLMHILIIDIKGGKYEGFKN